MTERDDEIHVHGRIYTFSRHYRDKPQEEKIATTAQVLFVMLSPAHFERQGNRRAVYERYVPDLGINLRVVEDRLDTGEWQILTAYDPEQGFFNRR